MNLSDEHFAGCMLGLASGDALGAPYEGGPIERALWRMIGKTRDGDMRWSDDTGMSLDLAESLLSQGGLQLDDLANRFAAGYAWNRGYGPGAAKVLKRIRYGQAWQAAATSLYPEGSFGNGAAMRAPVLAMFYARDLDAMLDATLASSAITHAHPVAVEGAVLVAMMTYACLHGITTQHALRGLYPHCSDPALRRKLDTVVTLSHAGFDTTSPPDIARNLGNGMTAATSCLTAILYRCAFS